MKQIASFGLLALTLIVGCTSDDPATLTAPGSELSSALEVGVVGQEILGHEGRVTGSAHLQVFAPNGIGLRKLTFSAIQHADGSVSGEWNLVAGATILHGDLDCLNILPGGDRARFSGIVTDAKFTNFEPGTAFALEVVDNGQGGDSDPDQTSVVRAFRNADPAVGRHFCETGEAPTDVEFMDAQKGNIQIHVP